MHDPKIGRASLRIENLAAALEQGIDNEAAVLDLLVAALAKGNPHPELWGRLHLGAARDDRISDLAFAYEKLCADRRFSVMQAAVQAEVLLHAAMFFADVFGDAHGARAYLERAVTLAPGRAEAFHRLEALLTESGEALRLADLYAAGAGHRAERGEQIEMLRKAATILEGFPDEDERAIKVLQQLLKIEPGDSGARRALEDRLVKAGRVAELSRMLEQALTADPPLPEGEAIAVRARLIGLYAADAKDLERALPHVEEVLARGEAGGEAAGEAMEIALSAGEALLARKPAAARAAAALEGAYERAGRTQDAAKMMSLQIESLRGPKRVEVQKRLADLLFQKVGDLPGAYAQCEQILAVDASDDRVRERYLALAAALDKRLDATRVLGRAATLAKDKAVRARMGVELGELYLDLGDARKARASFQQVLEAAADDGASLRAARALGKLSEKERDARGLAAMLGRVADLTPDVEEREEVAERLARMCEEDLKDPAGATAAYRKLLGTRREPLALEALTRLYEASEAQAELAEVLERRAELSATEDRDAARELALRAADIRGKLGDRAAAIEGWRKFVAAFGPSREVFARLAPLLEQERRWDELAEALAGDAELAGGAERAATLARLGAIRATRLGDPMGALQAYREALAIDPAEKTSRQAVERMLGGAGVGAGGGAGSGATPERSSARPPERGSMRPPAGGSMRPASDELRLAACAVLEPIARAENAAPLLLRVLEVKADLAMAEAPAEGAAVPESASDLAASSDASGPATARRITDGPNSVHDAETKPPPPAYGWSEGQTVLPKPPRAPGPPRDLMAMVEGGEPETKRAGLPPAVVAARLAALGEAVGIAEREIKDPKRAIDLAARGLGLAVSGAQDRIPYWVAEIERLTAGAKEAQRRAAALAGALGDLAVDSPALSHLARRAGEALAAGGDVGGALALYRRALAFEPSSPELMARVDDLLCEQGSPEDRIALYQEALSRPCTPERRRELLHAIGGVQRRSLGDLAAAAATYRTALAENQDDAAAYEALLDTLADAGAWDALYEELGARTPRVGAEDLAAHELRMAEVAARAGRPDRAADHYRSMLGRGAPLTEEALASIEALARDAGDGALLRQALERRVETAGAAGDAQGEARWLERLGDHLASEGASAGAGAVEGEARDAAAAAEALRRAAALAEGPLADADRALGLYERVLSLVPEHRQAAGRLLSLYRDRGAWDRLPAICEVLLETAPGEAEALSELAALEEAAIRAGVTDRFLAAADRLVARFPEMPPEQRRAVDAAVARVLAADPARQDEAAVVHRRLVTSTPEGDDGAMESFRAFLAASPDTAARREDRRWLHGVLVERAPEGEKVHALAAWAAWEENEMQDRGAAAAVWDRVIALDPEHDGALGARARLLVSIGDFEGAVEAIAARRDRSEGAARAALDLELAGLLFDKLGRPVDALDVIAPAISSGAAEPAALELLVRALGLSDEARARAVELLERAEAALEDTEARVALLETLLARGAADPVARRRFFDRLIDLHEAAPERALDVALRAAAELPGEMGLWERAELIARRIKQPERVIDAYVAVLDAGPAIPPEEIEELGRRAVEYYEEWFEAPETAMRLLGRLVELVPGSTWGFERLKLAYNAAERWDDLFALYDAMLGRTQDRDERLFLLEDAATVARDLAGDAERTMRYLESLLELQDDARTRTSLERLYERHGRHRPLIRLLEADLPRLAAPAAQKLRQRIALLWIDGVGEAEAALPVAEQMLEHEPASREAFDLVERILESTASTATTESGAPSEARRRAAALLERRYRAEDRAPELVRVLEIQVEGAEPAAQRRLLAEIVRLRRDALGDEAGALERLSALVVLSPEAAGPRAELAELCEKLGRHDRLAEVLAAAAGRAQAEDPALSVALLQEAAAIRRDRLGDADGAIGLLRQVFALAEEHGQAEAALASLRELDRLLAAGERVAERCDVLDLLAAREEPAARRAALGELARLSWSVLRDDDRAIAAFRARLAADPTDLEALDGLVAILEQASRFRELAAALDQRALATSARGRGAAAREDLGRVARLFERELGEPDQAVATWLRIREELGPDVESGEALAALYASAGRWAELTALLEVEARAAADAGEPARAAELYNQLGDAHRERTLAWEQAVESYRRAYAAAGTGAAHARAARAGLEALLGRVDLQAEEHRPALVAATAALLSIASTEDDWRARVGLLEPRLAAAASDEERVQILRESAALTEERGGDTGGAFDLVWRAFQLAPGPERPADLVRLADAAGRWATLAEALPALEARGDVPAATLRDLWRRVAAWERDEQRDAAAAVSAFERALVHEPSNSAILFELAELERRTRGPELVGTLLRLAEATGGDLELYREAVEVARDALGDRERARGIAERLLDLAAERWTGATSATSATSAKGAAGAKGAKGAKGATSATSAAVTAATSTGGAAGDPAQAERVALWAIDALTGMLLEAGERGAVVSLCRRGAALPFPRPEQRRLLRTAAEAAPLEEAIALYGELFEEQPADEDVGERLAALLLDAGRPEALIAHRRRQIAVCADAGRRVALRFEAAGLLAEGGEARPAIEALRENLEEIPGHAPSADKLAELLQAGGQHGDLARLYEEQAGLREAAGDAGAAALWLEAAALAERELGDPARAIASHRRAAALGSAAALDALARLLGARGDHAAAAEALEQLCALTPPDRLHVEALRLADAYVAAGRPERARACIERALGRRPDEDTGILAIEEAPLRERLSALYREAGEWVALANLIAEDAARAEAPATRLALLREAADLHLGRGGSASAAIPLLEEAVTLAPEDLGLRLSRCRALAAAGREADATTALREIIAEFGARRPKERALVHYELAKVALSTGDRAGAMSELDLAQRIDPAHPGALFAIANLAFEDGQLERAGRAYRALLLVARRPRPGSEAQVTRAEILLALAEIARRQGEADREAEHVESAFEAARESELEHQRLLAALRARGRHDVLARAIEARLQGTAGAPPEAERAALLDELAALCEGPLGRPDHALDARLRALDLRPDAPAAHEAALDLARRLEQPGRYVEALERLLERIPGSLDLHLRLARAHEVAGADTHAAEAYRRAEALLASAQGPAAGHMVPAPKSGARVGEDRLDAVRRSLEALYARLGDVEAQAEVLDRRVQAADAAPAGASPEDRADPRYRLAALRAATPATVGRAVELLEEALALHADADRAEAILRDALGREPKSAAAVRLFERLAREADRKRALVDALVLRADTEEPEGAAEALREAVETARAIGEADLAASILDRMIGDAALAASAAWALSALADLREASGDLAAAADLRERAARASAPDEERALLLRVAALAAGALGDLPRAARLYEELRAREPAEREIWEPLAEVHRRSGDVARLDALLEETVQLVDTVAERSRLRLERARLLNDRDADRAAALLREILDEDPSQVEAAILLASMLEAAGRTGELRELCALQLDAAKDRGDVPAIISLSMRLGALHEQGGDEHAALDAYNAAADWDPNSREVLRAIVRLTRRREDSLDLADALEKLLRVEQGEEAVPIALQLAELRAAQFDDAAAELALQAGYAACPTNEQLREELASRYSAREAWHSLAELYTKQAEAEGATDEARVESLCRAADILRQRAGDAAAAADTLERALRIAPSEHDVLLAFIDAAGALGQHDRAAEAVSRTLEQNPADPWLYRARAELHEAQGRSSEALADLERAHELDPRTYAADLVAQLERNLARVEAHLGPDADGPEAAAPASLRLRLAEILARAGGAGEVERAREHLTELLRRRGDDREALRALAAIEGSAERWDAAIAVHRRLVDLEEGEPLVSTALRLADACDRAARPEDAREGLERALRAAPERAEVRDRLRRLYAAIGAHRELAAMTLEDARAAADVNGRFAALLQAGRLLLAAEDPAEATAVLEEARGLRPDDQEAALLLIDASTAAGRLPEARALIGELIAAHRNRRSKQLGAVYHRLARLEALESRPHESLAALQKAFDNDPQNSPLAMELGAYAMERGEHELASRAFRSVTMMKVAPEGSADGTTSQARAVAYYHLATMALAIGDRRKARLMVDKSLAEDSSLEPARALLEELKASS